MQITSHSIYLTALSKAKLLVRLPLILLCFACLPQRAFSQYTRTIEHLTVLPFGCNDTSEFHHVTYDQILANWSVRCKEPNCIVTMFWISFIPKGKDFVGPYPASGSKDDRMALEELKLLRDKGIPCRIIVEVPRICYTGGKQKDIMDVTKASAIIYATIK